MNLNKVFVDTSFFYALIDKRDQNHSRALAISQELMEAKSLLVTSWEIIIETVTLLRVRHGYQGSMVFIKNILPLLEILPCEETERQQALAVFKKFSKEHRLSLCDCLSYVLVGKKNYQLTMLSFDEDFIKLGLVVYR